VSQSSNSAQCGRLLARKKARLKALIAIARKLLHAIHGIFRSGPKYEGRSCFQGWKDGQSTPSCPIGNEGKDSRHLPVPTQGA
jgi:hypothetical protein